MILDLYYIENNTTAHYLTYYHIYCIVFSQNAYFNIESCFMFKKKLGQWIIHHFVKLTFLFTTLKRNLGTEDTRQWSVSGVLLSHSYWKQVLKCATVHALRGRIFHLKMHHTFSTGDSSGLKAGHSCTRTLFFHSHALETCTECGFALSCWNLRGLPLKDAILKFALVFLKNVFKPFSIDCAF